MLSHNKRKKYLLRKQSNRQICPHCDQKSNVLKTKIISHAPAFVIGFTPPFTLYELGKNDSEKLRQATKPNLTHTIRYSQGDTLSSTNIDQRFRIDTLFVEIYCTNMSLDTTAFYIKNKDATSIIELHSIEKMSKDKYQILDCGSKSDYYKVNLGKMQDMTKYTVIVILTSKGKISYDLAICGGGLQSRRVESAGSGSSMPGQNSSPLILHKRHYI